MTTKDLSEHSKEELIALVLESNKDVENLVSFMKKTMEAFGVKDFTSLDHIGQKMLRGIPSLMADSIFPNKIKRRFGFFMEPQTIAMLNKHAHYFTGAAPKQLPEPEAAPKQLPEHSPKKLR